MLPILCLNFLYLFYGSCLGCLALGSDFLVLLDPLIGLRGVALFVAPDTILLDVCYSLFFAWLLRLA